LNNCGSPTADHCVVFMIVFSKIDPPEAYFK
jgi:hypothetical protein